MLPTFFRATLCLGLLTCITSSVSAQYYCPQPVQLQTVWVQPIQVQSVVVQTPVVVPQVQTVYQPQQQITYRDQTVTAYRREAKVEKVPVTSYRTVAVDEGEYKKVWVPKIVHKEVAKTHYENRVTYQDVPYKVTQRVPEVKTSYVPRQRVAYGYSYGVPYTRSGTGVAYGVPQVIAERPFTAEENRTADNQGYRRDRDRISTRPVPEARHLDTPGATFRKVPQRKADAGPSHIRTSHTTTPTAASTPYARAIFIR